MEFAIGLVIGFVIGAILAAIVAIAISRHRSHDIEQQMQQSFAALAGAALDANSRRLGETAAGILDGRKALIDQTLQAMGKQLEQVRGYLQKTESSWRQDYGTMTNTMASLTTITGELYKILASTQRRGAWGERMAEDVLRLAGMQEGINYTKQSSDQAEEGRPDFTFMLPNNLKVNMDVKFPLERYKSFLDATGDQQRAGELQQLVAAVRGHIRAVASRGYIDPAVPTVNYVIVFIPHEQLFSLVMESARDLMDEALSKRIVLASPLTLYAMLSVIRQAAENANVTRRADEIAEILAEFNKQWQKYNEEVDKLGQRIDQASSQFAVVRGTRSNVLQKQLDRIEPLRTDNPELPPSDS